MTALSGATDGAERKEGRSGEVRKEGRSGEEGGEERRGRRFGPVAEEGIRGGGATTRDSGLWDLGRGTGVPIYL